MTKSRWFRVLICLLMVCCLIFHMSPIKAEALVLEASLAIGLAACLIAVTGAGIVFVPETTSQIQAIGQSFQNYMTQWGTANNKLAEVQDWFFGIQFYDPGDDGDEDDDDWVSPTNRKVQLARGILAGISAWCASIILGNIQVEEEADPAPSGYMYYNGVELPALPVYNSASYPYLYIWEINPGEYALTLCPMDLYLRDNGDLCVKEKGRISTYQLISKHEWVQVSNILKDPAGSSLVALSGATSILVWSNFDIYQGDILFMPGTEPTASLTTVVEPETYVGDIPQQILDGELEPGGIELPDINYDPLIQPGISLQDSTIGTLHKLSTGELSYENYLQQIKVDGSSTDPLDPTPQPSEPSQDEDKWDPPTNPGKFAVDLKDFFPFCIPFDLYDFFSCLNADPVAPVIDWAIPLPGGSSYPITIDLSIFDPVAKILRTMELLLFCVGLAFKTRDLIRG